MSLHQYRLIRSAYVSDGFLQHMPKLVPFVKEPSKTFDPMFAHELAHVIEIFERGQVERLKMENLGWPSRNALTFTAKTATTECKVFAMQWLIEEMVTGRINSYDILGPAAVSLFLSAPLGWVKKDELPAWIAERSAKHRLQDAVREYKPKVKRLLDDTVDYMVDECAEHL